MFLKPTGPVICDRASSLLPKDMQLYQHLPYFYEVNDEVVRSRDNGLMLSVEIAGIDGFTSSAARITALRGQLAQLLDGLDDRFTFYMHRMMRAAPSGLQPMPSDGFAADIDHAWQTAMNKKRLQEFVLILTVVRKVQTPLKVPLFGKWARKVFQDDTSERLEELREVVSIVETSIPSQTTRLKISDGSLIGFYSALTTGVLRPELRGSKTLIAEDAANATITFHPRHFEIVNDAGEVSFGALVYVKNYSPTTYPGMLDALDASAKTIISHSYTPIERSQITERVKRRVAQMRAADDLAATIQNQLFEAADAAETGILGFGTHQMTITVFAPSLKQLDDDVSKVRGIAHNAGMRLARETLGLAPTFFACHPGNMDYRMRDMTVSSVNFADLSSMHAASVGTPAASLPWKTPITVFETVQGALHRFSFHEPGNPNEEPTAGHTLVLGRSGGGKTTTVAFLIAQAMRAGVRTILFDKEAGLKMAVTAMGGRYAEVKAGRATGLNPLMTEVGERGEAWLLDWFSSLLESRGVQLQPRQSEMLKQAIKQNAEVEPSLRNFRAFQTLFGDAGDNMDLSLRIGEWGPEGRYNWVFGEARDPVVNFEDSDFTAVDLTEILDLSTERTAILAYLFRRIEVLMEEKRPTLIVIDEAWKVLDDAYFSRKLSEWLVTARKKNVVVVMMTQFPSQIQNSKAKSVLEALPNQLMFPNREAVAEDYDGFRMSEGETGFILSGQTARRLALLRTNQGATILDIDLKALGPLLTVLGGGRAGESTFGSDYAERPNFWKEFIQ